jgi:phosphoribosylformylglycinamidine cyclo-ligase
MVVAMAEETTYKKSGVDIIAGAEAVNRIKEHVNSTADESVELGVGMFAGAVNLKKLSRYKDPVLVSSIDGVGTKLSVAAKMDRWDTVGKDIVNHSCNDILAVGGEPLFFLDYIASGKLRPGIVEQIVRGMSEACIENGIPLVAGETAEMPGVYIDGEHDVVGSIVGVAEKGDMIDGSGIKKGNIVIGLRSNGLHTNGYSLARRVLFDLAGMSVSDRPEGLDSSIGEALLKPHLSYVRAVLPLIRDHAVNGIAHITGGGMPGNIERIVPGELSVEIEASSIKTPAIFRIIQRKGNVPRNDMFSTFNMGIGMVLIVQEEAGPSTVKRLEGLGQKADIIGSVIERGNGKAVRIN